MEDSSDLLKAPQAAKKLGVTEATIRKWILLRKIDYVRVGRSVRISQKTITDIIRKGEVPAISVAGA